jgi:hypothetical protein
MNLTREQTTAISALRVTIDPIPRERVILRLDLVPPNGSCDVKAMEETTCHDPGQPDVREQRNGAQQAEIAILRARMERLWNPPIVERSWAPGYLPRNERTAVVMMVMDSNAKALIEEPRLIRPSGETGFDQAALETARAALPRRTLDTMGEGSKQISKYVPISTCTKICRR